MIIGRTGIGAVARDVVNTAKKIEGGSQKPANYSRSVKLYRKASIPEQKDTQVWQEIQRQRDQGRSDQDIWFDAVREGDLEIAGALIRKPPQGFDVNQKNEAGTEAVSIAASAKENAREMVKLLVEEGGADVTEESDDGNSVRQDSPGSPAGDGPGNVELATIKDYLNGKLGDGAKDAFTPAVVRSTSQEEADGSPNQTWFEAVESGDADAMRDLIKNPPEGWDVNAENDEGMTALQWAVRYGSAEMVETLVTEGNADITARDGMGRTGIELAEDLRGDLERTNRTLGLSNTTAKFDAKITNMKMELDRNAKEALEENDVDRYRSLLDAGANPPLGGPSEIVEEFNQADELDIASATFKNEDGDEVTVGDETLRKVLKDYAKGIADGDIEKGDARHTFYFAMQAQRDVQNGAVVIPYREMPQAGGSERSQGNTIKTTPEDVADLYDSEKVGEILTKASEDETIKNNLAEARNAALEYFPKSPEEYKNDIREMIECEDFENHLATLRLQGKDREATETAQTALRSYGTVASEEELNEFVQDSLLEDVAGQFEDTVSRPDNIEEEYWEQATGDWAASFLQVLSGSIATGKRSMNVQEQAEMKAFLKELTKNKENARHVAGVYKEIVKLMRSDEPGQIGRTRTWSPEMLERAYNNYETKLAREAHLDDKTPNLWNQQTKTRRFFALLNKSGGLSTSIGIISLSAGVYSLTKGEVGSGDPTKNLIEARAFLLTISSADEFGKLGSFLTEIPMVANLLKTGHTVEIFSSSSARNAMSINNSGTDVPRYSELEQQKRDLRHQKADKIFHQQINKNLDSATILKDPPKDYPKGFLAEFTKRYDGVPTNIKTKIAAIGLRAIGTVAYVGGGVAGIALGGLRIDKGMKEDDVVLTALGATDIASGTFTIAAAGAGGGAYLIPRLAFLAPFANPLFLAGAAIAIAGGIITLGKYIIDSIKDDDIASERQLETFETMGELGLLKDGWREKYEFLVKSFYGSDSDPGTFDEGVDSTRPHTREGQNVFDAFEWEKWLKNYEDGLESFGSKDGSINTHDYDEYLRDNGLKDTKDNLYEWYYYRPIDPPDHRTGETKTDEQSFENYLNGAVSIYHDRINLSDRSVPVVSGELKENIKGAMAYYYEHVNINGTPKQAATWVFDQIEDRIPGVYPDGEANTEVDEKDDGTLAKDIIEGYYEDQGGGDKMTELAKEVLSETFA